jgi:hypothetical protein
MNNTFSLYLLTRLDSISDLICTITVFLFILFAALIVVSMIHIDISYDKEEKIKYKASRDKYIKKSWIPLFLSIICVFTPTTKEAMFIYAGGKTLDYVQKDTSLQKIPYKATELIIKKMDQYLNDSTITK